MSEKIKYTDEPLGNLRVIPDFLPRPEELVFRDEGVKVTIALSKRSVEYFKAEARKHHSVPAYDSATTRRLCPASFTTVECSVNSGTRKVNAYRLAL